jgi:hypothetical protein
VLFGGKTLSFHVSAGSRPQIVRKHSTKPIYVVAVATERNGNIKDSCKAAVNVTVRVSNTTNEHWVGAADTGSWNITVEARLQGSVYLIDRSSPDSPKVIQLDSWHDHRHPYYWPKDMVVEAELLHLMDGTRTGLDSVRTEQLQALRSASTDYGRFTTFVRMEDGTLTVPSTWMRQRGATPSALQVWVRARPASTDRGRSASITIGDTTIALATTSWEWLHAAVPTSGLDELDVRVSAGGGAIDVDKMFVSQREGVLPDF